jgi:predicted nucleotidyltransferase
LALAPKGQCETAGQRKLLRRFASTSRPDAFALAANDYSAKITNMSLAEIRNAIDKAAPELRAKGLSALYLFGSEARGEASAESDIDFAFDVSAEANDRFSLIEQAAIQLRLQEIFGRKVDFLERKALHRDLSRRIQREMVRVL